MSDLTNESVIASPRLWATRRSGVSMLELMVVMAILAATAVLVLPLVTTQVTTPVGEKKSPNEITTQSTMQVIRHAMVGKEGVLETMSHNPDALPHEMADLVSEDAPARVLTAAPELSRFNPVFGIGWRGPYLIPTGKNDQGRPTIVDGWGREIELQADFDSNGQIDQTECKYIRLVSAGPNGQIETPADEANMKPGPNHNAQLTMSECGDDMVMFLCVPDNRQ